MTTKPDAPELASRDLFSAIYSVLVEQAGAQEIMRNSFIYHHTESEFGPCDEWRFQGALGFGGKYWRRENRVSCYREDETPERLEIIERTNEALSSLNAEVCQPSDEKRSSPANAPVEASPTKNDE